MTSETKTGAKKSTWRRWLLVVVLAGLVWIIVQNFEAVKHLAHTMSQAKWQWLLLAALLQIGYYTLYATMYRWAFYAVGIEGKVRSTIPVLLGSLVVGIVAPAWSAAGTALFVDDAVRRGNSPARATTGTLLAHSIDFAGFAIVLTSGMVILYLRQELRTLELVTAGIFLSFTVFLGGTLLLGLWKPSLVCNILVQVEKIITPVLRWLRRPPLRENWAEHSANEFTDTISSVRKYPWRSVIALSAALSAHVFNIMSLRVLFTAYETKIKIGQVIAGYAIGTLSSIVSFTPQGIGVVEIAMTTVFSSLGVPADAAAVIALTFRGLTFWLPLALGFVAIHRVRSFHA